MSLKDLIFSDLYLGEAASWLAGVPNTSDPIAAPAECADELMKLRAKCAEARGSREAEDFTVRHDDVSYRASLMRTLREDVYVLRRAPGVVPALEDLGVHSHYVGLLLQKGLRGLVVVAGAFAQGKTTTASAILASRVAKYGGVAVCVEDPPEMPLEGRCGEGVIYQRPVEKGGFAHECRQVARWAPSILFVGEVRDKETAVEALRASINGRLVICTIHSYDVPSAVDRIYNLGGANDDTASLMASGLTAVVHQQLHGEPKRPQLEVLWLQGDDAVGPKNLIRSKRFEQLGGEIQLQRTRIMMTSERRRNQA